MPLMSDCKYYRAITNDCKILKELYCAKEEKLCSFYKSKDEEQEKDEKQA